MKSRAGWILTRERFPPGNVVPVPLCVVLVSRRVTNKAVDDLIREKHASTYGNELNPAGLTWRELGDGRTMELHTTQCTYRLSRTDVYG